MTRYTISRIHAETGRLQDSEQWNKDLFVTKFSAKRQSGNDEHEYQVRDSDDTLIARYVNGQEQAR